MDYRGQKSVSKPIENPLYQLCDERGSPQGPFPWVPF
jgi:hypothetical protein